jgi:excisionase family DNA binding protein
MILKPEENKVKHMTVEQAAKLAGKTHRTIRNWIASGRLPAEINERGQYRVTAADVKKVIAGTWRPVK